ncbi:MAG: hypothetical protein S0880_09890, partial [Actinomycetota bacterium]|nr:hypothetical protein [Actinomycetota bacterium]
GPSRRWRWGWRGWRRRATEGDGWGPSGDRDRRRGLRRRPLRAGTTAEQRADRRPEPSGATGRAPGGSPGGVDAEQRDDALGVHGVGRDRREKSPHGIHDALHRPRRAAARDLVEHDSDTVEIARGEQVDDPVGPRACVVMMAMLGHSACTPGAVRPDAINPSDPVGARRDTYGDPDRFPVPSNLTTSP